MQEFHKGVLVDAFIRLLQSTVRLDRIEGGPLPETLFMDGARLAAARDDVDRVTLVATLSVLTRQVRASRIVISSPSRGSNPPSPLALVAPPFSPSVSDISSLVFRSSLDYFPSLFALFRRSLD